MIKPIERLEKKHCNLVSKSKYRMHKEEKNYADLINDKSLRTLPTSNRELDILPSTFSHRGSNETIWLRCNDRDFNLELFTIIPRTWLGNFIFDSWTRATFNSFMFNFLYPIIYRYDRAGDCKLITVKDSTWEEWKNYLT